MRERDDGRRWSERGIAMIRCMSVTTADQYAAHAARLDRFLSEEPVVWLSTVRPDGAPHLVPIWFTWDGTSLLVFSKPGAQKVRNLSANPVAMSSTLTPGRPNCALRFGLSTLAANDWLCSTAPPPTSS